MARGEQRLNLATAFSRQKRAFVVVGLLSGVANLLTLTGSLYMLQVYDRVLPSRSVPTLIGLTVLLVMLFAIQGMIDFLRSRIMARVGLRVDDALRRRVFDLLLLLPLRSRDSTAALQPVRDLDQIRSFLSGLSPTALFDMPWLPLFMLLLFALHPWMGAFGLAAAAVLVAITWMAERGAVAPTRRLTESAAQRMTFAVSASRNAEAIAAMGMQDQTSSLWTKLHGRHLTDQLQMADTISGFTALSKVMRALLQSLALGLGAWLAIRGEVSFGTIIACTIILGRALAPVEATIAGWKGFAAARQSWRRLDKLLALAPAADEQAQLPRPSRHVRVEGLAVAAPGETRPIITNINFSLSAGSALGVVGPSASGKSTLVRAIVGAWTPLPRGGSVRLDGAALDQYAPAALGRDIGYLPQDIEVFDGTVAQNIARLDPDAPMERVIEAARLAGCHDMILALPQGYNTQVGEAGARLSGGQRQQVGLARALYGDPFIVVLDEPNSNLDQNGEMALINAVRAVRQRGGIVIVIAHRAAVLAATDLLLAMENGQVRRFGPRDEVIQSLRAQQNAAQRPPQNLKVVSESSPHVSGTAR